MTRTQRGVVVLWAVACFAILAFAPYHYHTSFAGNVGGSLIRLGAATEGTVTAFAWSEPDRAALAGRLADSAPLPKSGEVRLHIDELTLETGALAARLGIATLICLVALTVASGPRR